MWGNTSEIDNIVWGNSAGDEDVTWGSSGDDDAVFADDTVEVDTFNPDLFDDLFEVEPIIMPVPNGAGSGLEGGLQ